LFLTGEPLSNSPAVAPVTVEKTIRTRTLSASEASKDSTQNVMPDFWEYIESLTPSQWVDHIVYLYREDPKTSNYSTEPSYVDKFAGMIDVRPGVTIPMDERGMIEHAIREKHGGKAFRLICKKGKERITVGKCVNDAPPKYAEITSSSNGHPLPNSAQTASDVASKAIDAMASQQPDAVRLAMDVLRSASDIVMRQAQPAATTPVPQASLIDQTIMTTLIAKALAPPPDPFEMFLRFKEIMQPSATNGVRETLELVSSLRNSGLFPSGSGKTSLLDLGREVIPLVATTARDAIHEWRVGVEAQVRGVEIARGLNPPAPLPPTPQPEPATPSPAPQPSEPASTPVQASSDPPFDWLAMKIVEILKDQDFTIEQAVDETLSFLYRAHTAVVALLLDPPKLNAQLAPGEQGLLMLFQHHPILKQIPVNPRLAEFIKKFVSEAKVAETERMAGAKPVAQGVPAAAVPPSA
jgi:hypothetical protein